MKAVAQTIRRHEDLLLIWVRAQGEISAGVVEGFGNKTKLTMRKAYGFHEIKSAEVALYHTPCQ